MQNVVHFNGNIHTSKTEWNQNQEWRRWQIRFCFSFVSFWNNRITNSAIFLPHSHSRCGERAKWSGVNSKWINKNHLYSCRTKRMVFYWFRYSLVVGNDSLIWDTCSILSNTNHIIIIQQIHSIKLLKNPINEVDIVWNAICCKSIYDLDDDTFWFSFLLRIFYVLRIRTTTTTATPTRFLRFSILHFERVNPFIWTIMKMKLLDCGYWMTICSHI